ncbi:MAG TPA: hypothetical protein VKA67_00495, partial [Verrucomicrobiae bacterium]|nr:hypothetical protein [Verrucomicrobiae bacterium]
VHLDGPGGKRRSFQGELFQNQMLSPTISAMALLESMEDTMESEEKQTIFLKTDLRVSGHGPVELSDVSSGEDAGFPLAMRELQMYDALLSNPCEFPNVKSLDFHVHILNGWKSARLDSLNIDRTEVKPGSVLHAVIGVRNFRGESSSIPISVPIPAELDSGEVQLFVGDADAAMRMDELPRVPPQTLHQVLDRIRKLRSHQNIYVKILQNVRGVSLEGRNLPDLPPSVMAQFESPNAHFQMASLSRVTLWETNFPVDGTFSGQITLPVRIK